MKVIVKIMDAMGGPKTPGMGADGFKTTPTPAGDFVIARCGQHVSTRYAGNSSIPWGAPLKDEAGTVMVKVAGQWQPLKKYSTVDRETLIQGNEVLYRGRGLPKAWMFNDFGPNTCYFFADSNKNGKRDGKERIQGEFFHTTILNESQKERKEPVVLEQSHGCIHLKPVDMLGMVHGGYFKRGTPLTIHAYETKTIPFPVREGGKPPFHIHVYPGIFKVVVVGELKH